MAYGGCGSNIQDTIKHVRSISINAFGKEDGATSLYVGMEEEHKYPLFIW